MKLLRVNVIAAETCGGLLDGLDLWFRDPQSEYSKFDPLCFIGRNGSGKSQFLQVLAEMFQLAFHACLSHEERLEGNPELEFELEYLVRPSKSSRVVHVRIARKRVGRLRPTLTIQKKVEYEWVNCVLSDSRTHKLLPQKLVGYTSGGNETLSLPFLISRSGYAGEVRENALNKEKRGRNIPDTRLMLIDYSTHLEVLISNLLLGDDSQREALLVDAGLMDIHSFQCIVQLNHGKIKVQLTEELHAYIEQLKSCATCYDYNKSTDTYIFDFFINASTKQAFKEFWGNTLTLYSSFHKLSLLNDLAIPKKARERFQKATKTRRFASRLPEPQEEDRIFRFPQVSFSAKRRGANSEVSYVSLSDGEHQLGQLFGTFSMLSSPNVLFLLDEPESHFNPHWRIKFISRILSLPTNKGIRGEMNTFSVAEQECIITTHSPFVPSDMSKNNVFIFDKSDSGKITVRNPRIETYGTAFDNILEDCFSITPPISQIPRDYIDELKESENIEEVKAGMMKLGDSIEKVFLADHLRQITKKSAK